MGEGFAAVALVAALLSLEAATDVRSREQPAACAVTAPNHNSPPDRVLARSNTYRYESEKPSLDFTIGNGQIWTNLWPNGVVLFRKGGAGFVLPDGSLKMKFLWWLAVNGPLTITGRRLDAPAPSLKAEMSPRARGAGFQPSLLVFPTSGCWEVTAKAGGSTLTFVTAVVKED